MTVAQPVKAIGKYQKTSIAKATCFTWRAGGSFCVSFFYRDIWQSVCQQKPQLKRRIVMGPQRAFRSLVRQLTVLVAFVLIPALSSAGPPKKPAAESYTLFESGQVRPLALSPDRQRLFAVNTPDNRLEVFRIQGNRLVRTASIPVGLEPVAVAARSNREVWVVNHLSDSVSVVELDDRRHGRARRAHAPRRRRAARHRLRRPGAETRVHHHGPPRPEHAVRSPAHDPGRGARGRLGLRRGRRSAARSAARR